MSNSYIFREDLQRLEKDLTFDDAKWCWDFDVDECAFKIALRIGLESHEDTVWRTTVPKADVETTDTINGFAERIIMNLHDCAYVDRYCAETTDCDKCVIKDNCDNFHEDIEITRELLHKMVQTIKESTPDKGGGK